MSPWRPLLGLRLVPSLLRQVIWSLIMSPILHQAIICTNAGILSIGPLRIKFCETLIKIQNFSFTKMHLKISSAKWRPFCPGGDELIYSLADFVLTLHKVLPIRCKWDLTFWGRDKMGAIFQTTFWNGFSWIKMYEFRFKFQLILLQENGQLTIFQHWFW